MGVFVVVVVVVFVCVCVLCFFLCLQFHHRLEKALNIHIEKLHTRVEIILPAILLLCTVAHKRKPPSRKPTRGFIPETAKEIQSQSFHHESLLERCDFEHPDIFRHCLVQQSVSKGQRSTREDSPHSP